MSWIRASLIVFSATAAAGVMLLACSADEGAGNTNLVDASPEGAAEDGDAPLDAGDAGDADARGPFVPVNEEVVCTGAPCAKEIVAGDDHFCARMDDGTVRCWGSDDYGALGRGNDGEGDDDAGAGWKVSSVHGLTDVVQLTAAGATTCARRTDGSVMCWGANTFGQLGLAIEEPIADFDPHPEPTPVALPAGATAARVAVGPHTACVVTPSGGLVCWGSNEQAQLARPGNEAVNGPDFADVGELVIARAVLGTHTTLVVTKSGEVYSWGALAGWFGPLAGRIASVSPDAVPHRVLPLTGITSIAASGWVEDFESPEPTLPRAHACAIAEGEVYCWGQTYRGALCTGTPDPSRLPAHAPNYTNVWPQQVAVSDELTCIRMTDGQVRCCGGGGRGRLGTGKALDFPYESAFVPATAFEGRAVQLAASNGAVCALVQGGTIECWGSNEKGELGQPTSDSLDHPSPVGVKL